MFGVLAHTHLLRVLFFHYYQVVVVCILVYFNLCPWLILGFTAPLRISILNYKPCYTTQIIDVPLLKAHIHALLEFVLGPHGQIINHENQVIAGPTFDFIQAGARRPAVKDLFNFVDPPKKPQEKPKSPFPNIILFIKVT